MSMMPICAVLAASSSLLEQLVDRFQLFLDQQRAWHVERVRPVNSYLAASSSTWYLSPSRSARWSSSAAN